MTDQSKTDRNSVRDILYRAGAEGTGLGAPVPFKSAREGLSGILARLEDGILPRRIGLNFDSGASLTLDIAERQILELNAIDLPGQDPALGPGPLSLDDAQALADLIEQVCDGADALRISYAISPDIDPAAGGVSLAALRRAAAVPPADLPQQGQLTWLDAIVDHPKVDIRSAVLIDVDEAHVVMGSREEAEALADWAVEMLDVFLADSFPLAPELETKGAVVFAPQQNGCHILLSGLRGQFLLALISGPDTTATLSAWQAVAETEIDGFLKAG